MELKGLSEQWLGMSDEVWDRHTNPASGWSRMLVLPAMATAIWSRVWLDWWCLVPVTVVLIWTWLNPRAFNPPGSTNNWMSQGILGERVWLNRALVPIPPRQAKMAAMLNWLAALGLVPTIFGLVQLNAWAVVTGVSLMVIAKLWFLDRMVWLFDEMTNVHPGYREWLR